MTINTGNKLIGDDKSCRYMNIVVKNVIRVLKYYKGKMKRWYAQLAEGLHCKSFFQHSQVGPHPDHRLKTAPKLLHMVAVVQVVVV